MGCLKPIQVYNLKKGEKAKFKRFNCIEKLTKDMNRYYENNNAVPCRKCIGCKLDNSKEWAVRSALECKSSNDNWFITLTYADEFIPINDEGRYTCRYSDLRRFTENLRQFFTRQDIKNIKYLASSEYGSRTQRPHYHICFFGLPLNDLELTGEVSKLGHPYFISKLVDRIWGKGIHKIGRVTYQSAGYVARYTLKKASKLDYEKLNIEPEKLYMSKGIGKKYFEDNFAKIYKYDVVNLNTEKGLLKLQPPRYFDRLYEKQNAEHLEAIKKNRIVNAKFNLTASVQEAGVGYVKLLGNKDHILHERVKSLKRIVKDNK